MAEAFWLCYLLTEVKESHWPGNLPFVNVTDESGLGWDREQRLEGQGGSLPINVEGGCPSRPLFPLDFYIIDQSK